MSVGTTPEPVEEDREELRGQMSFFDHLEELRQRIIKALIAVGIAFATIMGILGGLLPARTAARANILNALREL